jgi:hypothetical protein
MIGAMTDLMGPLATGVLFLGVAPALAMILGFLTVTRIVNWWGARDSAVGVRAESEHSLPAGRSS